MSKLNTITNLAPVTASTKSESPKIEWAGVETGAKIFVGLTERSAGAARAAAGTQRRPETRTAKLMRRLVEPLFRISFTFRNSLRSTSLRPWASRGSRDASRTNLRVHACRPESDPSMRLQNTSRFDCIQSSSPNQHATYRAQLLN